MIRFCHSLGVAVEVCDPHHPQQNGFIERYQRTSQEACLLRHRPSTLEQVREVTASLSQHDNWQRPHQGLACGNRPPRLAFADLPILRHPFHPLSMPMAGSSRSMENIWCVGSTGKRMVKVDVRTYYVSSKLAGQMVALRVNARERCLQVLYPQVKQQAVPLKGLYERSFSSQDYVELMQKEASTQHRLLALQKRNVHPYGGSSP